MEKKKKKKEDTLERRLGVEGIREEARAEWLAIAAS